MSDSIAFPNLGIYLPHVIKSFTVFGYEIAVYGITMALGILAGMYMAVYVAKKTGQDADDYMNLTLIGIFTGLICARAYYVIFSWDYYRLHPLEILDFRGGGLALYGSVIGAVSTAVGEKAETGPHAGYCLHRSCAGAGHRAMGEFF